MQMKVEAEREARAAQSPRAMAASPRSSAGSARRSARGSARLSMATPARVGATVFCEPGLVVLPANFSCTCWTCTANIIEGHIHSSIVSTQKFWFRYVRDGKAMYN